jgi:hypothetical protein
MDATFFIAFGAPVLFPVLGIAILSFLDWKASRKERAMPREDISVRLASAERSLRQVADVVAGIRGELTASKKG